MRRLGLACVLAFATLGVGTFGGYLVFAESIVLRIKVLGDCWNAQVGLGILAGIPYGVPGAPSSALMNPAAGLLRRRAAGLPDAP